MLFDFQSAPTTPIYTLSLHDALPIFQLYEDGTLLVRVAADSTFLGWGQDEKEFNTRPRLNPMALIELTTSFVHLYRSEEHTSELQSQSNLVCRLLLEKKKSIAQVSAS